MPPPLRDVAVQTDTNGLCTMFQITTTLSNIVTYLNMHFYNPSIYMMIIVP